MRYRLSTEVVGNALIRENLVVDVGDIRFEFIADPPERLSCVAASISVPSGIIRSYYGPGDTTFRRAGIEGADDAHQRVLRALRSLESHVSFSAGGTITSFSWNQLEIELIPDMPGERAPLRKLRIGSCYPESEAGLDNELLRRAALATQTHERTEVAKSFWREAMWEFNSQRYVQAYYNFYFILEGLYAGGKSSERWVAEAFTQAPKLCDSTKWMLEKLRSDSYHLENLKGLFEDEDCPMDVLGTHRLIVRLRGRLHHYSPRNRKVQPVPSNQAHFESPAWFLMGLTTRLIPILDIPVAPLMLAHPRAKGRLGK